MMREHRLRTRDQKADYGQIDERIRAILAEYRPKLRQNNVFMTPKKLLASVMAQSPVI